MTSDLETSYRHCRAVVRSASSNLASTFWLVPTAQRRGMDALYAFARQADDLVDNDEPLEARRTKLAQFRRAIGIRLAPYLKTNVTPASGPVSACGKTCKTNAKPRTWALPVNSSSMA